MGDVVRFAYFDYLRAIAIVLVVASHTYGPWEPDTNPEYVLVTIITGATAPFVFISGFFFHAVFYRKFDYRKFLKAKLEKIYAPYLVLITAFMVATLLYKANIPFSFTIREDPAANRICSFFLNLLIGNRPVTYWYIPFIMIIFVMSPVVIKFIRMPTKAAIMVMSALFLVSMYIHRPTHNINVIQSVVFFFPYYLLGTFYSIHRVVADEWMKRHSLALFIALAAIITWMIAHGQVAYLQTWNPFAWKGLDVTVIQKILLIAVLLATLKRVDHIRIPALAYIANVSFAIFFLHPWALAILNLLELQHFPGFAGVIFRTAFAVLASALVAEAARLVLKGRSQYITGY